MDIGLGVERTDTSFTLVLFQGSKFLLSLSFEHMYFLCLFLDPHLSIYQSNIGVRIVTLLDLCTSTLWMRAKELICGHFILAMAMQSIVVKSLSTKHIN